MNKFVLTALLLIANLFAADGLRIKAERTDGNATITSWGSGCFVGKHQILTAAHVIEKGELYAEVDGKWVACKLVKKSDDDDLALLECPAKGRVIDVLHLPEVSISGSVESKPVTERALSMHSVLVQGELGHGDSGAPILIDGRLAGVFLRLVLTKDGTSVGQAISSERVEAFLAEGKKE